jgi:hypothetical protein
MSERLALTPLCRFAGHTCAACCWGEKVSSATLRARLRRQSRVFRRCFEERSRLGRLELLRYELRVGGIVALFWAMVLLFPLLGDLVRPWLSRRLICAFLGYEDEKGERVGCLLHPSRWAGMDVRQRSAFALLKGVGCGLPSWQCLAAHFFAAASGKERRQLQQASRGLDWYAYSLLASRYRAASKGDGL